MNDDAEFKAIEALNESKRLHLDNAKIVRIFETGATRDTDAGKFDYEGFLCPRVLREFGAYMHRHRVQADGNLRDSDNWQKGIPKDAYVKSLIRHTFQVWTIHRGHECFDEKGKRVTMMEALMACAFNVFGYAFELLRERV